MTAQKCVHKGCGKVFADPDEECIYHPGPPIFHEGQKGWTCCKSRVLTFDEFLSIPPCTKGKHSAVDDTPTPTPTASPANAQKKGDTTSSNGISDLPAPQPRAPIYQPPTQTQPSQRSTPAPQEDTDDDDPSLEIPPNTACRRRGCKGTYSGGPRPDTETCVHHPGHPLFHEGSKGYTCCKRRVLEFDEFMRIEGCQTKPRHLFVGSGKRRKPSSGAADGENGEEKVESVRNDFYQTGTTVIVSLYLKKIDPARSSVVFNGPLEVDLDVVTSDRKRYKTEIPLYAPVKPEECQFKIMGTKLELTLVKADGVSWPVLRSDEKTTGEIIQVGRAGKA